MPESRPLHLLMRLTNCLQTILDLEPKLQRLEYGHDLLREFETLKRFLNSVDRLELHEADVERIEDVTANFLDELRVPLAIVEQDNEKDILH
ncbi:MAG: hypothetical protein ACNI3A_03965 [Desulfovibrio sp.]|uniref:hypothetical protein n=1 Tax=Desulfovibrio sp. 7SRBS1 TaxID=3378064 RepID=UPI003B3E400E